MSSAVAKDSLASSCKLKSTWPPRMRAIPILDTPLARAISMLRPALLLGLLVASFASLVADPVATMRSTIPVVAAVQGVYAVACLPVAGSQARKANKKGRHSEKKAEATGPKAIPAALLSLTLTAIATPVSYAFFVLFGAPLLDYFPHTMLCAAHFALIALFPIFYTRGVDSDALVAVVGLAAPMDETFGGLLGAFIGAWLGAVPIPLDWDRDWQRWPVTIVVVMYAGSLLGSLIAGTLIYDKRLAMELEE